MASDNQQIYRQVYNSSEDIDQLSAIDRVTCVLFRRGLAAAAFSSDNQLLTIHYAAYSLERPVWDIDFFEQLFHGEPLLSRASLVTRVFLLAGSNIVVPDELNDESEAEFWLRSIHFVDVNDIVAATPLKEDLSTYYYAMPRHIRELARISSNDAKVVPLAMSQFIGNYTRGVRLHCLLTPDEACLSLYHYGTMLWHRVLQYSGSADIAFQVKMVCQEHKINPDKISLIGAALSASEFQTLKELSRYFAAATVADGNPLGTFWNPVVGLFKHLDLCA